MASPISPQADPSILDTFKTKLKNEWTYHACHRHNANSKEGCLRADSESGEWVTHCCTKDFYNTSEIVTWMLLTDGQTGQTNLSALLSAAQDQDSGHDMRNQPGRLKAIDLGKAGRESYIVFAILLNLDCGSLIHTFQRYGITDSNLSNERLSNLEALEEQLQTSVLDVNKLLTSFDNMRFMFQHVIMELNTAAVYSDRCYSMALKTFTSENKHVFNQEKLNYSAVDGLAGMVQYLGEYEVDEEIDGQRVDRTWNLLLEFGDLDLLELFLSEKDPPSAFETIIEFWEALFKVAEAVEKIHNLEAHRERGDSVRYNGWHADLKPDNILRVHGEFKLVDLGFAKFRMKDETGVEPKTILTGLTETYGKGLRAPETDTKRRGRPRGTTTDYTQKIDIWSLGCVFSVAATWVILGRQGVFVYEKLRLNAIKKLGDSHSGRQPSASDAFHDGQEVLGAVTAWHNHLRSSVRKSDTITSRILDLIDIEMLKKEPRERLPSVDLVLKSRVCISSARVAHILQVERGESTALSNDIQDAIRQAEEEAEFLADMDGEGDGVKAMLSHKQRGDRSTGATQVHNGQESTRRNKSELLRRQAKKSMRLPRRDHVVISSHLSSRTDKTSFVTGLSAPGMSQPASGMIVGGLRVGYTPVAPLPGGRRKDEAFVTSNQPSILIDGTQQVESPKLMASQPEKRPGGAHPLDDATTPELDAMTPTAHTRALPPKISIDTREVSGNVAARDHTTPRKSIYEVDTLSFNVDRPQSAEETECSYIAAKSPPSPSRVGIIPRTTNRGEIASLPTHFHIDPNWEICRQLESIKKRGFFKSLMGGNGNNKILSSFLLNRDIKFVIDNGGSMRPYWPAMRIALETLASMIGSLDKDGLDIEFTLGKHLNTSNAPVRKLLERFDKAWDEALQPQDPSRTGTDMAIILSQIFFAYLGNTAKPMTLIVFTDGVWDGTVSDEDVERSIVEFLGNPAIDEKPESLRWFSIEFVSYGQEGVKKLEKFDDELETKYGIRDVIDHEPVSGDVYKMILGSLNKMYDTKQSDTAFLADNSSLSPGNPPRASLSRQNSSSASKSSGL
ncbi:uncharacterized protein PG998_009563, partial [Apiospora kogelbergensis]|uniref:uncharacterized protein n=1 Tax=Apiospora kogelbergensis TaxID=1337665 RepID=UPI00312D4D96